MKIIEEAAEGFRNETERIARANVQRKLREQGVNPEQLRPSDLDELVEDEKKILAADAKKVGIGIGVGIVITMLTGI